MTHRLTTQTHTVYVNQHESVSHIQIRHAYDFSLCFLHELLMSFLMHYACYNYT